MKPHEKEILAPKATQKDNFSPKLIKREIVPN